MYVHVHVSVRVCASAHSTTYKWRSDEDAKELILSFYLGVQRSNSGFQAWQRAAGLSESRGRRVVPERGRVGMEPGLREGVWLWGVKRQGLSQAGTGGTEQGLSEALCPEAGLHWSSELGA